MVMFHLWKKSYREPSIVLLLATVVMLSGCVTQPKLYDGYQVLSQPVADLGIIGKNVIFGVNMGPGAPSEQFSSLSVFAQSSSLATKTGMAAEIKKAVTLSLNLDVQKYSGIELKDIKLLFPVENLASMGIGSGDNVVIGAILVGSLALTSNESIDAQAKAELEQIAKEITKGSANAEIEGNKAELAFGKGLIVAIKLVKFSASRMEMIPLKVTRRLGNAYSSGWPYQVEVRNLQYPTGIAALDKDKEAVGKHMYCVALWLLNPFERESSGSRRWIPYCPDTKDIRYNEPPPGGGYFASYDPSPKYDPLPELRSRLPVPLISRIYSSPGFLPFLPQWSDYELAVTSLQVDHLSIRFAPDIFYPARLEDADGNIIIINTYWKLALETLK